MFVFNIFFGKTTASILFFLAVISYSAGSCSLYNSEDSKDDLIKIQITKDGDTIITIGNLWKHGRMSNFRGIDDVSSVVPITSRMTNPHYPDFSSPQPMKNDGRKMMSRTRSYHTSQIPSSPPPAVTTRKLMLNYDVTKSKGNGQNKRQLGNRIRNIAPMRASANIPDGNQRDTFKHVIKKEVLNNQPIIKATTTSLSYADDDIPMDKKTNETPGINEVISIKPIIVTNENVLKNSERFFDNINNLDEVSQEITIDINNTSTEEIPNVEDEEVEIERMLINRRLQKIVDSHYSWNILNAEDADCGESHSDRIIGGVEANLGQFPWIARLGYTVLPRVNETEYRCGGVLIGQQYVLTAAHCVSNLGPRTTMTKVRLGEHDISSTKDCLNGVCSEPVQDFQPINVTAHEDFMKRKYANDIAIIKLDRPVINNGWVSPICLPRGAMLLDSFIGESANVAGWGIMDMESHEMAERLQTVSLPILNIDDCQKEYKKKVQLTEEQMCAGGLLNKDACGGDSGGPLMKVATENGAPQYFLLGVVSFGPSDCGKKEPGVYANVSYQMPWILDNVEKLSS